MRRQTQPAQRSLDYHSDGRGRQDEQKELGASQTAALAGVDECRAEVHKRGDQRRAADTHDMAGLPGEQRDIVRCLLCVGFEATMLLLGGLRRGCALGFQLFEQGLGDRLDQCIELILRDGRWQWRTLGAGPPTAATRTRTTTAKILPSIVGTSASCAWPGSLPSMVVLGAPRDRMHLPDLHSQRPSVRAFCVQCRSSECPGLGETT